MCSIVTWTSFFSPQAFAHGSSQASYGGTKCTHVSAVRLPLSQRPLYFIGPANEYGAAAPAALTATAPAPAFFSSSRLLIRPSSDMNPPSLLAECSSCEACDEPVQERVVDECERDARDEDRGHDSGPVVEIASNQVGRH